MPKPFAMEYRRKKILIACDSSRSLIDFRGKLIEALVVHNDVSVYTPKIHHEEIRTRLDRLGVAVHENNLEASNVSLLSDIRYIYDLYSTIRQVNPDVFFPYAFKPVIYGSLIAKFCNVKRITPMLTGLGNNFYGNQSKPLIKRITQTLLKTALASKGDMRVILQNKDDENTLRSLGILRKNAKSFVVNGSGVDLSFYTYSRPQNEQIVFLMISRLINAKGIKEFYNASLSIVAKYPDVKFQLIGPIDNNIDSISETLLRQITEGNTIEYVGEVTDIRPYIERSSVVVLPSYYGEGIPRCVLESMAMGRAVITTDSVGCRETVSHSNGIRNGFLVPVKDVSALVKCMEYFMENKDDIIHYGENGRILAGQKFDVEHVNKHMLDILQN